MSSELFYNAKYSSSDFIQDFSMLKRRVSNQISILKIYSKSVGIDKYVDYINDEFKRYTTLVSEHIKDPYYLSESVKEFYNHSQNIIFKCEEMISSLYK